jgi:hypothetical protein
LGKKENKQRALSDGVCLDNYSFNKGPVCIQKNIEMPGEAGNMPGPSRTHMPEHSEAVKGMKKKNCLFHMSQH